nr:putative antennal esterase CXE4 [Ectropis grisescens]
MLKTLFVISLSAQAWCLVDADTDFFNVKTSKGVIVGQKASDGNYVTYFGIPYAKINEKKPFESTQSYPNFTTPFNATDPSIRCPQAIIAQGGILQCLRLNIYVPHNKNTSKASNGLPVYVWFHGGGLAFGSAGEYNASHLVQKNIIVITSNYRLGPYGFLCTSDIKNQGLEDMKTALRWIKDEIKAFGGDANKITIGGESWGASAVDFLLYEDANFNQAILESGSRFSFGVSTRLDNEAPIKLAARLGFNTTNSKDAINFLNTADPIKVMQTSRDLSMTFGVCEQPGDFQMPNNSAKLMNIPILIGYNSKEAFADFATQPDAFYAALNEELINNLDKTFALPRNDLEKLADKIWRFYLGNKTISRESMLEIIDLSSDFRVNYGAERSVTNYLKLGNPKVYKYLFSYTGGSPFKNVTGVGAYHTEELPYLFEWGTPLKSEEQFLMRRGMLRLWTNFIKCGHPTPMDGSHHVWVPSNLATRPYLNIDAGTEAGVRHNVYKQRMVFWDQVWSDYGRYRK